MTIYCVSGLGDSPAGGTLAPERIAPSPPPVVVVLSPAPPPSPSMSSMAGTANRCTGVGTSHPIDDVTDRSAGESPSEPNPPPDDDDDDADDADDDDESSSLEEEEERKNPRRGRRADDDGAKGGEWRDE